MDLRAECVVGDVRAEYIALERTVEGHLVRRDIGRSLRTDAGCPKLVVLLDRRRPLAGEFVSVERIQRMECANHMKHTKFVLEHDDSNAAPDSLGNVVVLAVSLF